MSRRKGKAKTYEKILEKLKLGLVGLDLTDEAVKKDLDLLERLYQEAEEAGLDKMTLDEIDELITAAKEEARKELFAITKEFQKAFKEYPEEELERAIDKAVKSVRQRKKKEDFSNTQHNEVK